MNIRTRFTLLFALIVGVILFFFSFAIYYLSEDFRQNDFYSRLQEKAESKLKLIVTANFNIDKSNNQLEENVSKNLSDDKIIIFNSNLELLYQDKNTKIPDKDFLKSLKTKQKITLSNKKFETLALHYKYKNNTYILYATAHDEYGNKYINNLKKILIFRGLLIVFIIVFSGWLYAGRFLKPISKIVQQADKITYSNLNHRLNVKNKKDEIGKLTATFNKMLERLENSFKIQKRFVSNASHELRNPLTAISGQIDVALLKDRKIEEYKAVLSSISMEIKNVRTLANNLLELANSEVDTLFQNLDEVRIDDVLWNAREELLKLKPNYTININFENLVDNEKYLISKAKENLLKIAFLNIIDNSCKYSENKTAEIKVKPAKSKITILFSDNGIGMPENYLKHAFEPFYRGSNAGDVPGNGIGLSLVYRVIKLHSGKIFIHSKINQGTTIEIILPNLS